MSGLATIQFTAEQARSISGVSSESLRHWRGAIPYLRQRAGKSARFTFSDVLGLAILQQAKIQLGISVAAIAPGAQRLFERLAQTRIVDLTAMVAVLSHTDAELLPAHEIRQAEDGSVRIHVNCKPLLETVCSAVLPGYQSDIQAGLPFPPLALRTGS